MPAATGHVAILLIAGICYVRGDTVALINFFGIPQAQAEPAANKWIAVQAGEKLGVTSYDDIAAGITLSSLADEIAMGSKLSRTAPATIGSEPVQGVKTPAAAAAGGGTVALYVTDAAPLRPVVFELTGGSNQFRMSFGGWGEALNLTAPAHPVPASSVTPDMTTA
jgi:hypothetical protein